MHDDKIHESIVGDNIRDKKFSIESNREDCDEESVGEFLYFLKRRSETQVNTIKELAEEEFRTVAKKSKRDSTS